MMLKTITPASSSSSSSSSSRERANLSHRRQHSQRPHCHHDFEYLGVQLRAGSTQFSQLLAREPAAVIRERDARGRRRREVNYKAKEKNFHARAEDAGWDEADERAHGEYFERDGGKRRTQVDEPVGKQW